MSDYDRCAFSEQQHIDACPQPYQALCTIVQEVFTFRHYYYLLDADELADAQDMCAGDAGTWMTP